MTLRDGNLINNKNRAIGRCISICNLDLECVAFFVKQGEFDYCYTLKEDQFSDYQGDGQESFSCYLKTGNLKQLIETESERRRQEEENKKSGSGSQIRSTTIVFSRQQGQCRKSSDG